MTESKFILLFNRENDNWKNSKNQLHQKSSNLFRNIIRYSSEYFFFKLWSLKKIRISLTLMGRYFRYKESRKLFNLSTYEKLHWKKLKNHTFFFDNFWNQNLKHDLVMLIEHASYSLNLAYDLRQSDSIEFVSN